MITYRNDRWQLRLICQYKGSVIPRALAFAIPASMLALGLHYGILYLDIDTSFLAVAPSAQIWSGYNFVISFLLVFRTQNAYSRYWEGGTLLHRASGQWRSALSSAFAFCNRDPSKSAAVKSFQQRLMQLGSMLHCMMLQEICSLEDENFEILSLEGLDASRLRILLNTRYEKTAIVVQWMQKLIAHAQLEGTLSSPPPIVSRCFQELSQGLISSKEALKIRDIVFPFPYLQVVQLMLVVTTLLTPVVNAVMLNNALASFLMTFIVITAFWSINYIAAEIEMPYGDDDNDIAVQEMHSAFNEFLLMLAQPEMQEAPPIVEDAGEADPANLRVSTFATVEAISKERSIRNSQARQLIYLDQVVSSTTVRLRDGVSNAGGETDDDQACSQPTDRTDDGPNSAALSQGDPHDDGQSCEALDQGNLDANSPQNGEADAVPPESIDDRVAMDIIAKYPQSKQPGEQLARSTNYSTPCSEYMERERAL